MYDVWVKLRGPYCVAPTIQQSTMWKIVSWSMAVNLATSNFISIPVIVTVKILVSLPFFNPKFLSKHKSLCHKIIMKPEKKQVFEKRNHSHVESCFKSALFCLTVCKLTPRYEKKIFVCTFCRSRHPDLNRLQFGSFSCIISE